MCLLEGIEDIAMTTFVILPETLEASVAIPEVKKAEKKGAMFIQAVGRNINGVVTMSYVKINKTHGGPGWYTPKQWLKIAKKRNTMKLKLDMAIKQYSQKGEYSHG